MLPPRWWGSLGQGLVQDVLSQVAAGATMAKKKKKSGKKKKGKKGNKVAPEVPVEHIPDEDIYLVHSIVVSTRKRVVLSFFC